MNPFFTFLHSWLLGGMTYPALTFVITAAMKSSAIVLLTWSVTMFLRRKPALMRLWMWRSCVLALLSVLLWALAPRFVDSWRLDLHLSPTSTTMKAVEQAQALELLGEEIPREPPVADAPAPLIAYTAEVRPKVPLMTMRMPWMERIEQVTFHAWWIVALLLLAWRLFRAACGHFWLRRHSVRVFSGTEYRLVRGLASPVVTGWRKACIWLPVTATDWPEAKLRAVCLHELAHHARHDGAWQWLGWLMTSVWWWNPFAWLALRQLTAAAELSADESALSQNIAATDYAQVLVEIAAGGDLSTPSAGVAMLGHSGIQSRVKALLSGAGQHGVFGRKSKLALMVTAFAAVMAAGVEVRHMVTTVKPSDPLTEAERTLVERTLAMLESQQAKLNRVHLKMTLAWKFEGPEPVSSPQPSVIEAWVDEAARQSRTEYRPRVTRWTSGAAPWFIKNETEATDGQRSWSYEEDEMNDVRFSRDPRSEFFSPWAQSKASELVQNLRKIQEMGFKHFGNQQHRIREEGDRVRYEVNQPQSNDQTLWEIDLAAGGVALYRVAFPGRSDSYSREWKVQKWGRLPSGTSYPSKWSWQQLTTKQDFTTYENEITMLETIPDISPALLAPPQKAASPYVATDGKAVHGEVLETRFVNAKNGQPVPDVEVHFEINDGARQKVVSSSEGMFRIPLPSGEVKSLRFWGLKTDFVMQCVSWRRHGDPLKLPELYEVKLYPAGKSIGGVIVDEEGKPVVGAEVNIHHSGYPRIWNVFADYHATTRTVKTDKNGRWRMTGYAEDLSGATIRVEHPDHKRVAVDYRTATGQGYESLRDGTSKVVMGGGFAEFSGRVTDQAGKPVAGCAVTIGEDRFGHLDEPQGRTGTDGRYTARTNRMGMDWITFEIAGFQPATRPITVAAGTKPSLDIKLTKALPLRVQIVDEAGQPVPEAWVLANRWQRKRPFWFEAHTNADGRFEWSGAPPDEVTWDILKGDVALRDFPLIVAEDEQRVSLRPAIRFTGTVLDARTGQHVASFKVTPGDTRRSVSDIYWRDDEARSFREGTFVQEVWSMRQDHKLRIEAEGYKTYETPPFTAKQQNEALVIKLAPAK